MTELRENTKKKVTRRKHTHKHQEETQAHNERKGGINANETAERRTDHFTGNTGRGS